MRINLFSLVAKKMIVATGILAMAANASAASFSGSLTPINGFALSDITYSNDPTQLGSIFPAFTALFDTTHLYSIGSFTGQAGGSDLSMTCLAERGAYYNDNTVFVQDASGNRTTIFAGTDNPGATRTVSQSESTQYTLGMSTPQGYTYYSVEGMNPDGLLHMFAIKAVSSGTLTINNPGWGFGPALTVSVLAGDYAIFMEDLFGGFTNGSDRDFNDFVGTLRQTQHGQPVPEPATLMLLGMGVAGLASRKFSRKAC